MSSGQAMAAKDQIRYHLEQALALDSHYAAPRMALAHRLLENQHPNKAAAMFAQALNSAAEKSNQFVQAATGFQEKNNFDRAKHFLLKAVDQNHLAARAALELGLINVETGETEAAREQFTRAVELDPDLAQAYYHLGVLAHDRPDEACDYLRKAVGLDFRLTVAHLELARRLEYREEAEFHYLTALDLDPNVTDEQLAQRFG